jgi:hypothetical protein
MEDEILEVSTSIRDNPSRIPFKDTIQGYHSRIPFKDIIQGYHSRIPYWKYYSSMR